VYAWRVGDILVLTGLRVLRVRMACGRYPDFDLIEGTACTHGVCSDILVLTGLRVLRVRMACVAISWF
jgi:hypothetical protein